MGRSLHDALVRFSPTMSDGPEAELKSVVRHVKLSLEVWLSCVAFAHAIVAPGTGTRLAGRSKVNLPRPPFFGLTSPS